MPKPSMRKEDAILENQIIETLIAGLKQWRPDLGYPQSYSDMQACVRGLLIAFEVKRRPLPKPLDLLCDDCEGLGHLVMKSNEKYGYRELVACEKCHGRGHYFGQ